MKNLTNKEVKLEIWESGFPYWKIAREIGVSEMTLHRWLREDISEERLHKIRSAIEKLKEITLENLKREGSCS